MATFSNIAGQEPSTVSFRVATVVIPRGSTNEQQEILCLGDPESSNAIAAVVNTRPNSTAWGLVTRDVWSSTGVDQRVSESAGSTHIAGQVALSSAAAVVVAANANRKRLLIVQLSTCDAYLGVSTVTTGNGLLLSGVRGNQVVIRSAAAVYGIVGTSTGSVSYLDESHV